VYSPDANYHGISKESSWSQESELWKGQVHFPPNTTLQDFIFYLNNNHILLSVCLAHRLHPHSAKRRGFILINSVSFAFFLTSIFAAFSADSGWIPQDYELTRKSLSMLTDWPLTTNTLLQLAWDVPGSMLAICPCARLPTLSACFRRACGYALFACLACHLLLGVVYGALGTLLLMLFGPVFGKIALQDFLTMLCYSKGLAFLIALPVNAIVFALLLRHERRTALLSARASSAAGSDDTALL